MRSACASTPYSRLIQQLAECRWSLAQLLRRQGNNERARSLILANLRMLDEVPKGNGDPIIAIWRTLARLDLHEFKGGSPSVPDSCPDEANPLSRLASSEADNAGRGELGGTGGPVFELKAQRH